MNCWMQVWRENQQRIVGFFPRAHSYQLESHSWIYTKNQRKYSIMLTKIMILATDYLYRYSCEMPAGVREYVDKGMNCEDIAMNFLVSNFRFALLALASMVISVMSLRFFSYKK
jgi:hypothetical protein